MDNDDSSTKMRLKLQWKSQFHHERFLGNEPQVVAASQPDRLQVCDIPQRVWQNCAGNSQRAEWLIVKCDGTSERVCPEVTET